MSCGNGQPMKIVFIDTQCMEIDIASFKFVVQRLTEKDFVVGTELMYGGSAPKRRAMELSKVGEWAIKSSVLSKEASFKEFDGLLKEIPPLDELLR
ncbi:VQ motif-containing protein 1-like [Actinidia eriantha]|uniref:VQ motif-containing protein 1-like n=1 Tax=Actinidia eriantha TaxID=165200 RepID=UPI00258ABDDC|nr:VQ motif-containing protein 1-like [Actinidia eriantha]